MNLFRALFFSAVVVLCGVTLLLPSNAAQLNSSLQSAINGDVSLTFTTIDVPGAGYTQALGINSGGNIVGIYGQSTETDAHGFSSRAGTFTFFDYPGESITVPFGINDTGLIAGYAGSLSAVGFVYDGVTFTLIRHGNDSFTTAFGINNANLLVGGFGDPGSTRGYELRGQKFKTLSPPPGGWIYVYAQGINNLGQIVGWDVGAGTNGFLFKDGTYQTISVPGALDTEAYGINDDGIIVGWNDACTPGCYSHGFALRAGKFIKIDFPGAEQSYALGISKAGQIVGAYQLADHVYHGFVTSPITGADF
jgi:probable HAF family extracellular repeat protein